MFSIGCCIRLLGLRRLVVSWCYLVFRVSDLDIWLRWFSSSPILIRWRLLVCEGYKGRRRRWGISFEFQLYFVWVFTRLLCSEECLPGLFENSCFSQIRRWNALVVFGVDTSKFGVVMSSRVFNVGILGEHLFCLLTAEEKKARLVSKVRMVRSNFSFPQRRFLFKAYITPTSCQGLLGISGTFFFSFSFSNHYKTAWGLSSWLKRLTAVS